jgi:hypothetical protein
VLDKLASILARFDEGIFSFCIVVKAKITFLFILASYNLNVLNPNWLSSSLSNNQSFCCGLFQ